MTNIIENFTHIQSHIKKAERSVGREEGTTRLIAVTKTQSLENIEQALSTGQRLFGENKVQEAQNHWSNLKLKYPDVVLHLIGPLQSNKAMDAVALFDVIETLDREKLAVEISKESKKQNKNIECYIQINTGEETQKSGVFPQHLGQFLDFCVKDYSLNVTGLMCIPPVDEPPSLHFALLKKLAQRHHLKYLSMGMSTDYKKAIVLGATHIRLGTALFGERSA